MADSVTWLAVKAHAEKEIERNRDLLEGAQPDTLATIQARIRVWREVLELPGALAAPVIDANPSGYS